LARLSSEGLVDASPQRGFRATPITPERLQDLTTVRIDIETMCLRQSMPQFDELADVRLDQALEAMLVADVGSDEQLAARNRRQRHAHFHEALVAGCRSQVLLGIRRQLLTQSERYRSLTEALRSGDETLDRDHRRMVEAVQRRDTDLACDLLTEHIRETSRLLLVAKINGEDVIPRA
jgi:GntR family carbon starvation induced transcriptional regulator